MAADFYKELGVSRTATPEEIKKAYRKLAAELHPDRHPGDKKIEARFKAVNRAYQTLIDPDKRKLYDEFGEEGLREGFNPEVARAYRRGGAGPRVRVGRGAEVRFEDLFGNVGGIGDIFGDFLGGRGRRGPARGADPFCTFGPGGPTGGSGAPDTHLFRVEKGKLRYVHTLTHLLQANFRGGGQGGGGQGGQQ